MDSYELDLTSLTADIVSAYVAHIRPAVAIKKSVTPDYLICLEDGKKFKSLKRHLKSHYDLSPEDYREKWGLPSDYPMVAPAYAAARSDLAKTFGLGRRGAAAAVAQPEAPAPVEPAETPKGRIKQTRKASKVAEVAAATGFFPKLLRSNVAACSFGSR